MKKIIVLYSKNKKNIDKITGILKKNNFIARIEKSLKSLVSRSAAAALLIIDISNLQSGGGIKLRELFSDIEKLSIAKIIIIDPIQIEFLSESKTGFDDFVLCSQLEPELTVRIKLVLLKNKIFPSKNSIVVNGLVLNLDKYELSVNNRLIELTFKEFELFKLLLQHQDKVFSRNKLLSAVWEYDFYGGSRTVDVHMRRLRSKIPPPYNLMLKTVRNVGYMFSS